MEGIDPARRSVSPRQWATIVGMGEGATRLALREGRLTAVTDENGRTVDSGERDLEAVRAGADQPDQAGGNPGHAAPERRLLRRWTLGPDEELIRNAELFLSAANDEPTPTSAPVEPWAAVERERELVGTDAD